MDTKMEQSTLSWHPQRGALINELHSRPFRPINTGTCITHLALLGDERVKEAQAQHLQRLIEELGSDHSVSSGALDSFSIGSFDVRMERHLEFTSLTLTDGSQQSLDHPFSKTALERLPQGWLEQMPGTVVAAFHVRVDEASDQLETPEQVRPIFNDQMLVASSPLSGQAKIWTSFRLHEGGYGRFLVLNSSLSVTQLGRMVQRTIEVETYRMMALLGFPDARALTPVLAQMDHQLVSLTNRLAANNDDDDASILRDLTDMAATIEAHRARTSFRVNATRAYHDIMLTRLDELREDEVDGHLTMREFLTRRLSPAVRSSETMQKRLDDLSTRIHRTSVMMRTRVELEIQNQNRELLRSMDRRSKVQLMMQHTVEGLSVAAISYYLVGLVKYITDAAAISGFEFNKSLVTGLSVPIILGSVFYVTRRIHRRFHQLAAEEQGAD